MQTFICNRCKGSIIVGHPADIFRRNALALAHDTYSLVDRVFHRSRIRQKLIQAMEEKFYLEPDRYRTLPHTCPKCGFENQGELPWWRRGLAYP